MDKGKTFRALHEAAGAFVFPNPWDIGTAKLLTSFGFKALATTSAGCLVERAESLAFVHDQFSRGLVLSPILTIRAGSDKRAPRRRRTLLTRSGSRIAILGQKRSSFSRARRSNASESAMNFDAASSHR